MEGEGDYDEVEDRTAEIVENLLAAGYTEDDIEIRETELFIDAQLVEGEFVFVEGDMHVSLEASREFAGIEDDEGDEAFRHWRTPGLVANSNAMICLAKLNGGSGSYSSYFLTGQMETGVNWAKNNFNNTNGLSLSFKVGDATVNGAGQLSHSIGGCDHTIWVYQVAGGAGGSAGFPSGGAPYSQVKLNSGLAGYSNNVHEHVATHEIGHSIGLRHTDWQTRQSCGQNVNEGQSGASQISGTAYQTTNSIMAACFSGSSNGEFRGEDKEALDKLY